MLPPALAGVAAVAIANAVAVRERRRFIRMLVAWTMKSYSLVGLVSRVGQVRKSWVMEMIDAQIKKRESPTMSGALVSL